MGYIDVQGGNMLFRGVILMFRVSYTVHEGYIDVQGDYMLFRGVI